MKKIRVILSLSVAAICVALSGVIASAYEGECQFSLEGITVIDLDGRPSYDYTWSQDLWEVVYCPEKDERSDSGWSDYGWQGSSMNFASHNNENPIYYTYLSPESLPTQISANPYDQMEIKFSVVNPNYERDNGEYTIIIGNRENPLSDINVYCFAKEIDLYVQRCHYKDSIDGVDKDDFCHANVSLLVDLARELASQGIAEVRTPYGDFSLADTQAGNYTVRMPLSSALQSAKGSIKVVSDPVNVTISEHSTMDFSESAYIQQIAALQNSSIKEKKQKTDSIKIDIKSKIAVKAGESIKITSFLQLFKNGEMCSWETRDVCENEGSSVIYSSDLGKYNDLYLSDELNIISFSLENESYAELTSGPADSAEVRFKSGSEGKQVKLYVTLSVGKAIKKELKMEYLFEVYSADSKVKFTLDGEELPRKLYDDCDFAVYSPLTGDIIEYIPSASINKVPYSAEMDTSSGSMQIVNSDTWMHSAITFLNTTASSDPVTISFGGEKYTVRIVSTLMEDFISSSSIPMNEMFVTPCIVKLNQSKYLAQYLSDIAEIHSTGAAPHTVEFPAKHRVKFIQNEDNALKEKDWTAVKGVKECEKSRTTVQIGDVLFDIPVTVWDGEDKIYVLPKKTAENLAELYSLTSDELEKYAVDLSEDQVVNMSDMVINGKTHYTTFDFYVLQYPDVLASCTPVLTWGKDNGELNYSESKGYYSFVPTALWDSSDNKKVIITLNGSDTTPETLKIRIETGILHFSPSSHSYKYPLKNALPQDLNYLSENISMEEKLQRLNNAIEIEQGGATVKTQKLQLYIDNKPYEDTVYYVLKNKSNEANLSSRNWKLYKESDSGVYGNIYTATGPINVNIKGKDARIELLAFISEPTYSEIPTALEGVTVATVTLTVKGSDTVSDFIEISEENEDLYGTYTALANSDCIHKPLSGTTLVNSGDMEFYYSYELIADQKDVVLESYNNDSAHILIKKKESLILPYAVNDIRNGYIYVDGFSGGKSIHSDDVMCLRIYNTDGTFIREVCGECPEVIKGNGICLDGSNVIPLKDKNGAYNFIVGVYIKTEQSPCIASQNVVLAVTPGISGGGVVFADLNGEKHSLNNVYKAVTTGKNGNAVTIASSIITGGKIYFVGINSDTGVQEQIEYTGQKVYVIAIKETVVTPPNSDTPTVLSSDPSVAAARLGNYDTYRSLYSQNNAEIGVIIEGEDEGEAIVDVYGMYGAHCSITVSVQDSSKKDKVNYASYVYDNKFKFEMETAKENYTVKKNATLLIPIKVSATGNHPFSKTITDPYDELVIAAEGLDVAIESGTLTVKGTEKGRYTVHITGYDRCTLSLNITVV